jgi:hypothetical protein
MKATRAVVMATPLPERMPRLFKERAASESV